MSGLLVGGGGGREREERAARWSAAVVKFSGSGGLEADIDKRGFGRSSDKCSAFFPSWYFPKKKIFKIIYIVLSIQCEIRPLNLLLIP